MLHLRTRGISHQWQSSVPAAPIPTHLPGREAVGFARFTDGNTELNVPELPLPPFEAFILSSRWVLPWSCFNLPICAISEGVGLAIVGGCSSE